MSYLKETLAELKNVKWPNRKHIINYTIITILLSFFVAYLLGAMDFGFSQAMGKILGSF
ncbi:preprotein translocase subunit SecE [Candidatus Nomurabacteria bacterium RIFCSPHIGHO2_02_FULL_38_15]|uniref:Preprotein translocase subunit SecE n=1 Tax=Candidatus Nomurabacteria bacterium RIFCSPHIGHO2_02_FULL_38_15 TaxID=1801752 RepID=A0A1F6VQE0_9BACT|nr:MAG: preprotein translocase subunit SecE [Candidatus Nomurabacteria bacterium RIFCSPHIGHO2_02_FULL_38_15]